ncbi:MAG: UDP-N-acetylmuramoyl-L-alanine--D-glutamate ligase [Kiritimatiellae bacterium]|jgi:UDP-N-acetylmuramoylalanine--D-glutamate ligase|nr:UDP-N-acetylmuramoyl-L-alanine--D-glutamate ligase [Kiritimatiellia bacterium]
MCFEVLNVLVLGGGLSGISAARLLLSKGSQVTLVDSGDSDRLRAETAKVADEGGRVSLGEQELPAEDFDLCVVSPVFALDHPWVSACRVRGLKIISELELGALCWRGKMIAITGSKGKSSIVKLCSDTLNMAGITASPAGNYGIPLSYLALEKPELEWAVTEVSSFQMEHTEDLSPEAAILLNVQPDHLNRHGTMDCYKKLKLKMFASMQPGMPAFLPEDLSSDDPRLARLNIQHFGISDKFEWHWQKGYIRGQFNGRQIAVDMRDSWFDNEIFGVSASAAVGVLSFAGLNISQIEEGFQNFSPLEHRMEQFFCSNRGVCFINDSKATSLSAMAAALKMVETPVRLIAGGLLKENLSENIKELLTRGTKKVYLIGNCCRQMFQAWSDTVICVESGTLEEAVKASVNESEAGETVLLSPGTASFDQFNSYCERGERFKELVREVAD